MLEPVTSSPIKKTTPKAGGNTFESDDMELDSQLEKDMMAVADKMENGRLTADRSETPDCHIHTKQSESTTSSVITKNSTYAMMKSKVPKMLVPTTVTPAKQAHVTNLTDDAAQVHDSPLAEYKDLSPIYTFENGNCINIGTFSTNQTTQSQEEMTGTEGILHNNVQKVHVLSAIPPGTGNATKVAPSHGSSDGYMLVTEGAKQAKLT